MDPHPPPEDRHAAWIAERAGLVAPSLDRFLGLMAEADVEAEAWRAAVLAEVATWRALRDAPAPPAPPALAGLHRRFRRALALLAEAGDHAAAAIEARDAELLVAAFGRLDAAGREARACFAEVWRPLDARRRGG